MFLMTKYIHTRGAKSAVKIENFPERQSFCEKVSSLKINLQSKLFSIKMFIKKRTAIIIWELMVYLKQSEDEMRMSTVDFSMDGNNVLAFV